MKHQSMHNKTVLVIGGGNYGTKACLYFKEQKARVILVDNDPACKARSLVAPNNFVRQDAQGAWTLVLDLQPDLIVPTAAGHTCGKWIGNYFGLKPLADSITDVTGRMPQSLFLGYDEPNAGLIFSYMTRGKLCRADCPHPPGACGLTREPRPAPLYKLLEYAVFGLFDCAKIFVSEQMAPSVGAIKASEFLAFMKEVKTKKPGTLAVGTACRCHGILNLFKRT
ncbi:MAG: NAD(P)-dependent oxidoreductase [Verrucomicrobiota bacterium]